MKVHGFEIKSGANLSGVNLSFTNLYNADLRSANLHGANLRFANLQSADLRNADMRNADMVGATLHGADLRGADLRGADMRDTKLYDADLGSTDLRGATFDFASWPLSCKTFYIGKCDDKLFYQFLYHALRLPCDAAAKAKRLKTFIKMANKFHMVGDFGKLKPKGE